MGPFYGFVSTWQGQRQFLMKLVPTNWSDANAVVTDATNADVRQIILKLVTVRCIILLASTIVS
jgi:hypothetical protein